MTVAELIEDLRAMPETAHVSIHIRKNIGFEGGLDVMLSGEFREADPLDIRSHHGEVVIELDEYA